MFGDNNKNTIFMTFHLQVYTLEVSLIVGGKFTLNLWEVNWN